MEFVNIFVIKISDTNDFEFCYSTIKLEKTKLKKFSLKLN